MRNTEIKIRNLVNPDQEWFPIATGCKPGQEVADGYGYRKAPESEGEWDLYQIAEDGQHVQFVWLNNA